MTAHAAADFLFWTGMQDFMGPVNAACDGALSAYGLYQRVGEVLEAAVKMRRVMPLASPGRLSPFDLPGAMVMDTSRAQELGYRFGHTDEWLDHTIRQHDLAFV
jgi:hypothetical protein